MERIITEAYRDKNWDVLSMALLNNAQMIQIQHALESEDFNMFASIFQLIKLQRHQGLQLQTGNLYLFVTTGLIMKKNDKPKDSKLKRMAIRKQAIMMDDNKTILNFAQTIPRGFLTKIEDFLTEPNKPLGYFFSNQQQSVILRLSEPKIPFEISCKIKNYYSQKLRFINRLQIFGQVPKNIIQQSIQHFKFVKVSFNDLIYSKNLRNSYIFILKKGQAIIQSSKKSKGIIVKSPTILGDEKLFEDEQARCITQYCVCYAIQKTSLESIYRRKANNEQKQFGGFSKSSNGFIRAKYLRKYQTLNSVYNNCDQIQLENIVAAEPLGENNSQSQNFMSYRRNRYRKIQTIDQTKKDRIKEHFSNFLSEKFSKYQAKISKNLYENQQQPILYQMKGLLPSVPNYQQINSKLKQIRLKKILQPKDQLKKSNSIQCLILDKDRNEDEKEDTRENNSQSYQENMNPNEKSNKRYHEFQKDKINAKIIKALDLKIAKEINRKYNMRVRHI